MNPSSLQHLRKLKLTVRKSIIIQKCIKNSLQKYFEDKKSRDIAASEGWLLNIDLIFTCPFYQLTLSLTHFRVSLFKDYSFRRKRYFTSKMYLVIMIMKWSTDRVNYIVILQLCYRRKLCNDIGRTRTRCKDCINKDGTMIISDLDAKQNDIDLLKQFSTIIITCSYRKRNI